MVKPGYKQSEIGVIPEDWDCVRLGEKVKIYRGGSPRPIQDYITTSSDGVNWIKIGDVGENDKYIRSTQEKITPEGISKSREVHIGDFILSNSMSFGRPYILDIDGCIHDGWLTIQDYKNTFSTEYLYYLLSSDLVYQQCIGMAAGSSVKNLNKDKVSALYVIYPAVSEQERIAEALSDVDDLIFSLEKLIEKYKSIKVTCLQQMFPQKGETTPKMRLPGFTGAWEQRKLGEVLISLQNNTLSRADLSSEEGIAKNIHYGDILVKFGEVIDLKTESLPMIADETVIAKYKSSFLQNGDVIVADTAEDETVGKCTEIAGLSDEIVISGLHTIPYRPLQKYAPGYLGYYMNSASFHNQLLPLMQGIKVTSISKTALQNTDILYPKSATEQAAIGKYFRNLDNLITLHQRKLNKTKKIKQGMMQQLLTGKIRLV